MSCGRQVGRERAVLRNLGAVEAWGWKGAAAVEECAQAGASVVACLGRFVRAPFHA